VISSVFSDPSLSFSDPSLSFKKRTFYWYADELGLSCIEPAFCCGQEQRYGLDKGRVIQSG
jgi:hypothetical protein